MFQKRLSILLFCLALAACSKNEEPIPEEQEPVTTVVQECECETEDKTKTDEPKQEAPLDELEDTINSENTGELEDTNDVMDNNTELEDGDLEGENLPEESTETQSGGGATIYTVAAGDTLTAIANRFGVTAAQIQSWNNIASVDSLYVGQILNILGGTTPTGGTVEVNAESSDIAVAVVEYILSGQEDKRESDRLNWNESFLQQVNKDALYQEFLDGGGRKGDIEAFAEYLTTHAPILDNWESLVKAEVLQEEGIEISKFTSIDGDRYRAYIQVSGVEVPEFIVSARTGFFSR